MLQRLQLKITSRMLAWGGIFWAGFLPCPDCGLPLAVKIWPVAAVVWLFNRFRQRQIKRLDFLLLDDDQTRPPDATPQHDSAI